MIDASFIGFDRCAMGDFRRSATMWTTPSTMPTRKHEAGDDAERVAGVLDEVADRLEAVAEVRERHVREADAADPLDAHHPRAALGQAHREGAGDEEEDAEAQREREERRATEHDVLRRGDDRDHAGEERTRAGRRDEAHHEAHDERALEADAADRGELVVEARRQRELEGAEHRRRERGEEDARGR